MKATISFLFVVKFILGMYIVCVLLAANGYGLGMGWYFMMSKPGIEAEYFTKDEDNPAPAHWRQVNL